MKNEATLLSAWLVFTICLGVPVAHGQAVSLSTTAISFANQVVGTTSQSKLVVVTNSGTAPLNIASVSSTANFGDTTNCVGVSLAAKGKCSVMVTFAPTATGLLAGTLTLSDDAPGGSQTVSLKGTGVVAVTIAPATLGFGSVVKGLTSAAKSSVLTNNQSVPLNISSIVVSASFVLDPSTTCGSVVIAKGKCKLSVTFNPTGTGKLTGSLTINDDAVNSPSQSISLSGTGTAVKLVSIAVTPNPASIYLGSQQQFTATGLNNDHTSTDLTSSVTWSSSSGAVATISNVAGSRGLASSSSVGTTAISAKLGTTVGFASLSVVGLTSIAVTPANAAVAAGLSQQFTATGTYSNSTTQDITASVVWKSSNSAFATISNSAGTQGLASGVSVGATTISASSGSLTSNGALLTVQAGSLTSISVAPPSPTINTGDTQQFTATGHYSDGTSAPISATWSSANSGVASIDTNGLAVGDVAGSAMITAASGSISGTANLTVNSPACASNNRLDMRLLVVMSGGNEADLPAITTTLDYLHMPYTVFDLASGELLPGFLYSGCHAFFNGVILADGGYIYAYGGSVYSALTSFESTFGIRQVNWFTFPGSDFGFNPNTGTVSQENANFTPDAASVFPYANQSTPVPITDSFIYKATAVADGTTTVLLSDASGNALAVIKDFGQGRQYLTLTFASNQYLLHNMILSYGLVNWVTHGLFVGEKHIYFTAQEDDWGIDDHQWQASTTCDTGSDSNTLPKFRLAATDADAFVAWQAATQSDPLFGRFKLYNAFNGFGFTTDAYPNDTLTPWSALTSNSDHFGWINHTFDHTNLDGQSYATDSPEISQNIAMAATMGFTDFNPSVMVTPDISGLNDANFLQAAVDNGVQYLVSDTSRTNDTNNGPGPGFNLPIINSIQPSITEIPRRANNLFFNAGDPDGWVGEYQCIYAGQSPYDTYNYQQIRDYIANTFVVLMLQGDADPEMFHQTNLAAYDGTHSVLSDLLDDTFNLYKSYFNLPVMSVGEDQLGQFMLNNLALKNSGLAATVNNGASRTVTLSVQNAATIPVTGLSGADAEMYGGQSISHIAVPAQQTLTVPAP